jgi:hypothetical protein
MAAESADSKVNGYSDIGSVFFLSPALAEVRFRARFVPLTAAIVAFDFGCRDRGMSESDIDRFIHQLRELLASEYRRGHMDALKRILHAAQDTPVVIGTVPERQRKDRAPTGAPQALVERVLTEAGSKGASASDIAQAAISDIEKMVSFSGLRFALVKGRTEGRYLNKHGKWFLRKREAAG